MNCELSEFKRPLWTLAAMIGFMYLAVAGLAAFTFVQANQAHDALCTFRGDLDQRVASGKAFLNEFPSGIPGIPTSVIRTNIANQQRTLDALDDLSC